MVTVVNKSSFINSISPHMIIQLFIVRVLVYPAMEILSMTTLSTSSIPKHMLRYITRCTFQICA